MVIFGSQVMETNNVSVLKSKDLKSALEGDDFRESGITGSWSQSRLEMLFEGLCRAFQGRLIVGRRRSSPSLQRGGSRLSTVRARTRAVRIWLEQ